MSMFDIGLSGLNAASSELEVTSNNIANSETTGFKRSRAEFADVYAEAYGGISQTATGDGVRLAEIRQEFTQGNIDFTGNNLDLAVSGQGFFILSDNGAQVYSRAGALQVDRNGFVIDSLGRELQVFPSNDPAGSSFNVGSPQSLQLVTSDSPPNATTQVDALINLDADATVLGAGAIDPTNPATYSYSSTLTVYDSLGGPHTATSYYRRTGNLTWDTRLVVDGDDTQTTGVQTMTFDSTGNLTTAMPVNYGVFTPTNGANPLNIDYDLTGSTQFGGGFGINNLAQDGFTSGRLTAIEVSDDGVFAARYTNGQTQILAQVALANFASPQGLQQIGDNAWAESFESGAVQLGQPGTSSLGLIQSGGLEQANVDIAEELVGLITAERFFQANAQVITTADQITQTIINLR
ncbi:MAG: flagellar hook protein FlgE [Chromatiales bacterium]